MVWADIPARSSHARPAGQRALGLALVVLLHVLLLAALLQAVIHPNRPAAMREIFLRFIPHPPAKTEAAPPASAIALPSRHGTRIPTIALPPATAPPVTAAPDLSGLGQNLFGCTPEALAVASPQARSQCLNGLGRPSDGSGVIAPRDHVKDPDRWANAIKERNAPPGRVPCTYITETPVTGGMGGYKVPMVQPDCLYKLLSH